MNISKEEGEILQEQFEWLKEIISWRLNNPRGNFESIIKDNPIPDSGNSDSAFLNLVAENKLDSTEQLILLLSLAPYFVPDFLNAYSKPSDGQKYLDLFFNQSLINKSNYPTFETALTIFVGLVVENRQLYFPYFGNTSRLFKEDIIALPNPPHGEPFTRSTLTPSTSILNNVLSGTSEGPEFSHDFPAMLISSDYIWDDLIVDYDTQLQLKEVKEWLDYENICKQKDIKLDKFKRGYKCLFHGPPGTGKTLAASLIGKLTKHDVYRIDLSAVVSKYIGETEKNLAKIFDRASHGNWILFFDEADALFGKRGATQNAHDRYANQEVSYLLQRFESYEGVSILASNFKENIDTAFYRRFHSIVSFKKPEADERLRLWKVHLPKDFKFANDVKLNEIANSIKITGAGIYNVMRRCCMKAVLSGNKTINGKDMFESVKLEFAKENKTI